MQGLSLNITIHATSPSLLQDAAPRPFSASQFVDSGVLGQWQAQGWPGAGAATASATTTLWAGIVSGSVEGLALAADLTAFHTLATPKGSSAPLARGITLSATDILLPFSLSPPPSPTSPTGLLLRCTSAVWQLVGAPAAGVYRGQGVAAPAALHTFTPTPSTSTSSPFALYIPPGSLFPGYLYRASLALTFSAAWYTAAPAVAPWDAPVPQALFSGGATLNAAETLPLLSIPTTTSSAPFLFIHAPPTGGTLALTPATGKAFVTQFIPALGPWMDADTLAMPAGAATPSYATSIPALSALLLQAGTGTSDPTAAAAAPQQCPAVPGSTAQGALQGLLLAALQGPLTALATPGDAAAVAAPFTPSTFCAARLSALQGALAAPALTPIPTAPSLTALLLQASLGLTTASSPPFNLAVVPSGALSPAGWASLLTQQLPLSAATAQAPVLPGTLALSASGTPASLAAAAAAGFTLSSSASSTLTARVSVQVLDARGASGIAFTTLTTLTPLSAPVDQLSTTLLQSSSAASGQGAADATALLSSSLALSQASNAPLSLTTASTVSTLQLQLATTLTDSLQEAAAGSLSPAQLTSTATSLALLTASTVAPPSVGTSTAALAGVNAILASPPSAASTAAVLTVLSNVAGATTLSTAPPVPPAGYMAEVLMPPLPTGGLASPALAANASAAVQALSLGALRAAGAITPGAPPVYFASAPPAAVSGPTGPPYCGPAFSVSTVVLSPGASSSLEIKPALNPCMPQPRPGAAPLPPSLLASAPPPSVALTPAATRALGALYPGRTMAIQVVQHGLSPVSEITGLDRVQHAALPAVSDVSIAASTLAAQIAAGIAPPPPSAAPPATSSAARALGYFNAVLSAIQAAVAGSGGTNTQQASQSSLLAVSPRSTTAQDMLSGRPMDSRSVSLSVLGVSASTSSGSAGAAAAAAAAPVVTLPTPVTLVIPLRDLSVVTGWDPSLPPGSQSTGVNVGQGSFLTPTLNITCPLNPTAAAARIQVTVVTNQPGLPPPASSATVTLVKATQVSFTGVVGSASETAAGAGGDALSIAGDTSQNQQLLSASGAGSPTLSQQSYTYVLSVSCGPAFGAQTLSCGVGMEGTSITYVCPAVVPTATCLWYDPSAPGWSNAGTKVLAQTPTSVTCSTTHLATHAIRFAALPQLQADIFSAQAPLAVAAPVSLSLASLVIMALSCAACALAALTFSRAQQARGWAEALEGEAPLAARRRGIEAQRGAGWVMDAAWDAAGGTGKRRKAASAKVAPLPLLLPSSATAVPGSFARAGASAKVAPSSAAAAPVAELGQPFAPSDTPLMTLARRLQRASGGSGSSSDGLTAQALAALFAAYAEENAGSGAEAEVGLDTLLPLLVRARLGAHPPALLTAMWHWVPWARAYYHPLLPASLPLATRLLLTLCSIFAGLLGMVVFYVWLLGSRNPPGRMALPALTPAQFISLTLATAAFVTLPLELALKYAIRAATVQAATLRYPEVTRELACRAAVAAELKGSSAGELLGVVYEAVLGGGGPGGGSALKGGSVGETEEDPRSQRTSSQAGAGVPTPLSPLQEEHVWGAAAADRPSAARARDLFAAAVAAVQAAQAEGGGGAASSPTPAPYYTPRVAALTALLLGATLFCAFYSYAFAMTRGAVAVNSSVGAWVLSVAIYLALLRPLEVYLLTSCELRGSFAAAHAHPSLGLPPERCNWAEEHALCLGLYALAMPRASHACAGVGMRGGGGKHLPTAIAALAPLSALRAVLEKEYDALHALQAGLAELVYSAALSAALAPPPPLPPPALAVKKAMPLTMQLEPPPPPPLPPPRLLAPRLQLGGEGAGVGVGAAVPALTALPRREGLNLGSLGAGAAAWDRRARFSLAEEGETAAAAALSPISPPPHLPPRASVMPSPWSPTAAPRLLGVSPLQTPRAPPGSAPGAGPGAGAGAAPPSTSASARFKERIREVGAQSLKLARADGTGSPSGAP